MLGGSHLEGLRGRSALQGRGYGSHVVDIGGHPWAVSKSVSKMARKSDQAQKKTRNLLDGD